MTDPFLAQRGMATRDELVEGRARPRGLHPLLEGLVRRLDPRHGRRDRPPRRAAAASWGWRTAPLLAFFADHGEEFHDHGRMLHGQSVYGEMIRVPLIFWGPGRVPKGRKVEEPVELIDVMPTLLELSRLARPQGRRDRASVPCWRRGQERGRQRLEARVPSSRRSSRPGRRGSSARDESYAIVDGSWKLIHNVARPPDRPEFELFDFFEDPLDQKNVAAEHPDVVERLAKQLDGWHAHGDAARSSPTARTTKGMTAEQLEQLRSLGYIK